MSTSRLSRFSLRASFLLILLILITGSSWGSPLSQGLAQAGGPDLPQKPLWDRGPSPTIPFAPTVKADGFTEAPQASSVNLSWYRRASQSYLNGNWDIYVNLNPLAPQVNVTAASGAADSRPRISHDGQRIAFHSNRDFRTDVYTMNFDGSGVTQLTREVFQNYSPEWSPDDKRLVFVSNRATGSGRGIGDIFVMNANGSAQTRLTANGFDNGSPTWSPDGKQIAWTRYNNVYGSIWVMNADGSGQRAVTPELPYLDHPVWSPDGSRIAFDCDADGDDWNEITVVNPDGSGFKEIYDPGGTLQDAWMGDWSLHGEVLVITQVKYVVYEGQLYMETSNAASVSADGSYRGLVTNTGVDMHPDVQSLDPHPPSSRVLPLPEYSPLSGFEVSWVGYDKGLSGLAFYQTYNTQYRLGSAGSWVNLFEQPHSITQHDFIGTTSETVYFRTQAVDEAGNWGTYPTGNGDTWTKLYHTLIDTRVGDNRGYPLPGATVSVTPAAWETNPVTGIDGWIPIHFRTPGQYLLSAEHSSFRPVENIARNVVVDTAAKFYLLPKEDRLQNGDFESGFTAWQKSGTLPIAQKSVYSGANAAVLGQDCEPPCLSGPETPFNESFYAYPNLAFDLNGNLHAIWRRVNYAVRDPQGNWSPVHVLGDFGHTGSVYDNEAVITTDLQGGVHVVVIGQAGMNYLHKPAGGDWGPAEIVGKGSYPAIAADAQGNIYVTYSYYGSKLFRLCRKRLASGTWETPVILGDDYGMGNREVAVGPDGTVHFFYITSQNVYYRQLSPGGILSDYESMTPGIPGHVALGVGALRLDSQNRVHVVANGSDAAGNHWLYITRSPQGEWSTPVPVADEEWSESRAEMVINPQGGVHIVAKPPNESVLRYFYKTAGSDFFEAYTLTVGNSTVNEMDLAGDQQGGIALAWTNQKLNFALSTRAAQAAQAQISQPFSIPAGLHQPTLAFDYALKGWVSPQGSGLRVSISDGVTTTPVFTQTGTTHWSHAWIDLASWSGKDVTVKFQLDQAESDPIINLLLDNISVGEWLSPLPQSVLPNRVKTGWGSLVVTINGENFLPTPTVRFGNITLNEVEYVDEHTLRVTLPADFPYGAYDVWVINPQGQVGAIDEGFDAGCYTYLPVVTRKY